MENIGEFLLALLITAAVLFLTYWTTRKMAGQAQRTRTHAIQILDRLIIARDRQIALVKVGDQHFLAGITSQTISFSQPIDSDTILETMTIETTLGQERPWIQWLKRLNR